MNSIRIGNARVANGNSNPRLRSARRSAQRAIGVACNAAIA